MGTVCATYAYVALKNLMMTNKILNNILFDIYFILKKIVVLFISHVYNNQVIGKSTYNVFQNKD